MDNQIRAFMRVIRKLDDADELIRSFPEWEQSALSQDATASSQALLTPDDQRRLLDFPDPETQAANIAASSALSKQDLLARAAEAPAQLSAAEVALLKNRYWLAVTPDEEHAIDYAKGLVFGPHGISDEEFERATARLRAARCPFYAANEEKALDNSLSEHRRRQIEALLAERKQAAVDSLAKAFPWVRRLWEEDECERVWGYGVFYDPGAFVDAEEAENYECRQDNVLDHALGAVGAYSGAIRGKWRLLRLDWPAEATADNGEKESGSQAAQGSNFKEESGGPAGDEGHGEKGGREQQEIDERRAAKFQVLRRHFKSLRDRAPKRQRQEQAASSAPTQAERGGLEDGILQNVFLVIDRPCVESLFKPGIVDDMWVWAIDPDYDAADTITTAAATATTAATTATERSTSTERTSESRYEGFMRVRLQQLANNFYDARRFHEDEHPMSALWEAAQKSKNQAFVSLKEEEAREWIMDRFIGSVMRSQPPRYVWGPKAVVSAATAVPK